MNLTKKQELTVLTIHETMRRIVDMWKNNYDDRLRSRYFYIATINIKSGYSTPKAMSRDWETTEDHVFTPQFIGRFILDNPEAYLGEDSFETFKKLWIWASTVMTVTKEENTALRGQTTNSDGVYTLDCSMADKYENIGVTKFYKKNVGYVNGFPFVILPELLEYEKQFIV